MKDNFAEISDLFEYRESSDIAGGYTWFCKKCSKECNVGEVAFQCQCGRILPKYIICRYGCGKRWMLELIPEGEMIKH